MSKSKKKRANWVDYIVRDRQLSQEFLLWCRSKKRKINSLRRLAYLFLKSKYGNEWIRSARFNVLCMSYDELVEIAKTNWINFPGED